MLALCHWIDKNNFFQYVNSATPLSILLEVSHYFSMMIIVGCMGIVDLRILGLAGRKQNLSEIAEDLLPWVWIAVTVNAISGAVMFTGEATGYWISWPFRIKMILVVLAIALGLVVNHNAPEWGRRETISPKIKLLAFTSMMLWIVLILAGNLVPAISNTG